MDKSSGDYKGEVNGYSLSLRWLSSIMMCFMGGVGTTMRGSGLEEALGIVYGSNAVNHTIGGKAVSRTLHGHFLVEATNEQIAGQTVARLLQPGTRARMHCTM